MIPRLYCPSPLPDGGHFELPEALAHHAVRVLRLTAGQEIRLFDGSGGEWRARLTALKPHVVAHLETFVATDLEPPIAVTLVQSLPSGDKMDWVVQKAVELGVTAIQPVAARRSVVKLSGDRAAKRVQHWQAVAVAACEQCGRNRVPEIAPILDLTQYLARPSADNECRLLLSPGTPHRLRQLPPPVQLTLLVGPEGGWEDTEIAAAEAAGFAPMGLGPRVLRTETAGPAALAAIMAIWGDL